MRGTRSRDERASTWGHISCRDCVGRGLPVVTMAHTPRAAAPRVPIPAFSACQAAPQRSAHGSMTRSAACHCTHMPLATLGHTALTYSRGTPAAKWPTNSRQNSKSEHLVRLRMWRSIRFVTASMPDTASGALVASRATSCIAAQQWHDDAHRQQRPVVSKLNGAAARVARALRPTTRTRATCSTKSILWLFSIASSDAKRVHARMIPSPTGLCAGITAQSSDASGPGWTSPTAKHHWLHHWCAAAVIVST